VRDGGHTAVSGCRWFGYDVGRIPRSPETAGGAAVGRTPSRPDGREEGTVSAVAAVVAPPLPPAAAPRPARLSAGERVRYLAIAPLWLVCAAGWGLTSATLLTWDAVRELPWLER
jgi:hypothetical protein